MLVVELENTRGTLADDGDFEVGDLHMYSGLVGISASLYQVGNMGRQLGTGHAFHLDGVEDGKGDIAVAIDCILHHLGIVACLVAAGHGGGSGDSRLVEHLHNLG